MSRGLGKSIRCDGCDKCLSDYHGDQLPGEVQCSSIVFGAHDVVLCKACSQLEFEEEEKAGSNDLPQLLKRYRANRG